MTDYCNNYWVGSLRRFTQPKPNFDSLYQGFNPLTDGKDSLQRMLSEKRALLSQLANDNLAHRLGKNMKIDIQDITITGRPIEIGEKEFFTISIDYKVLEEKILENSKWPASKIYEFPFPDAITENGVVDWKTSTKKFPFPDAITENGVVDWKTSTKKFYQTRSASRISAKTAKFGAPFIKIKPSKNSKRPYRNFWKRYKSKQTGMQEGPTNFILPTPPECHCNMTILMRYGCQCGGH